MNYKNKFLIGIAVVLTLPVMGCGNGSEDLVPSESEKNMFAVDPSDNSAEGEIRRVFYDNTGIFLLYTDFLGTYTDNFGNEKEERVDFNWGLDTSNSSHVEFDELDESEKEEAARLILSYFVPYVNVENGTLKPYSVLLVKNLRTGSDLRYSDFHSCFRCFCVNMDSWIGADEEDAKTLGKSLLRSLAETKIDEDNENLVPFFAIGEEYYEAYISDYIPGWIEEQNMEWIYEKGFLSYSEDWWYEVEYDEFCGSYRDLSDFIKAVFNEDEAEFKEKWSGYPLIIQKYDILKECVESIGIDFNAVK